MNEIEKLDKKIEDVNSIYFELYRGVIEDFTTRYNSLLKDSMRFKSEMYSWGKIVRELSAEIGISTDDIDKKFIQYFHEHWSEQIIKLENVNPGLAAKLDLPDEPHTQS